MITKASLEKYLGRGRVKTKINLSPFLTIKMHAVTHFFFETESEEDLIKAKEASLHLKIPLIIIGGGSNVAITNLASDSLVVKNRYLNKEKVLEDTDYVYLSVSSGYPVSLLVRNTIDEGLAGLEYHLGLPGTVGGAIYMNSKWTKPLSYFGDHLVEAEILDNQGHIKKVGRDYFQFDYDFSILQKTKEILLKAVFKLKKSDPKRLLQKAEKALEYRKRTQPFGVATCGCFFRNPPGASASYLIDHAHLKGLKVGSFVVSEKHANFIINKGQGKPEDLVKLLSIIKTKVKEKFGVELEEEVVIL